jgi:hypothetical protein
MNEKLLPYCIQTNTMTEHLIEKRKEKFVIECVNKWKKTLAQKNIAFVDETTLIQQLRYFESAISHFKTRFRRTDIDYEHPVPVMISHVINGHTKIWTKEEQTQYREGLKAIHSPRGIDTNGDKETGRFRGFIDDKCPEIKDLFTIYETVRGSSVDIILICNMDNQVSFPLQIGTANQSSGATCNFNKIVKDANKCLQRNIIILLIFMVNNKLAGLYFIPPTPAAKKVWAELAEAHGTMNINPVALNTIKTKSKLYKAMQKFRYLHKDFKKGVNGDSKDLDDFTADFLDMLCDNYHVIVNTPFYFSSLFEGNNKRQRSEWAANVSFKINVADVLSITETTNHGERGDMLLDFGEFHTMEERKILVIQNGVKSKTSLLYLRKQGQQGLHPSKVGVTTGFQRVNRGQPYPSEPDDFNSCIIFPVLTELGELAMRPDDPSAIGLSLSCDAANQSEYIEIMADKIGVGAFPAHMCEIVGIWKKPRIRIKAVFYYNQLKDNPEKLNELRELYRLFAERTPSENAIAAYENAVTDELITNEKNRIKKSKINK